MIRDKQIDVLKGLGILFVIAGHMASPLSNYFYSFHMGIFFFITGYLYKNSNLKFTEFLKKKFIKILIPYFIFWLISLLWAEILTYYETHSFIKFELRHLLGLLLGGEWLNKSSINFTIWYFQLFFIANVLTYFLMKFNKKVRFIIMVILIFVTIPIQNLIPGRPVFHINALPTAMFYVLLGDFIRNINFNKKFKKCSQAILLIFIGFDLALLYSGNIAHIGTKYYFVVSTISILGYFILSGIIKNKSKILSYFGENSLFIFGFHSILLPYTSYVSKYILGIFKINNVMIIEILCVIITAVLCCGLRECYLYIKDIMPDKKLSKSLKVLLLEK